MLRCTPERILLMYIQHSDDTSDCRLVAGDLMRQTCECMTLRQLLSRRKPCAKNCFGSTSTAVQPWAYVPSRLM